MFLDAYFNVITKKKCFSWTSQNDFTNECYEVAFYSQLFQLICINQKWELGTVFIAKALMYLVVEIEKILLLLHGPVYVLDECIQNLIIRDGFSLGNWHIQIGTSQFGIMQSYRLRKVHVRYLLPDRWLLFHWQGSILQKFFNPLTYYVSEKLRPFAI